MPSLIGLNSLQSVFIRKVSLQSLAPFSLENFVLPIFESVNLQKDILARTLMNRPLTCSEGRLTSFLESSDFRMGRLFSESFLF